MDDCKYTVRIEDASWNREAYLLYDFAKIRRDSNNNPIYKNVGDRLQIKVIAEKNGQLYATNQGIDQGSGAEGVDAVFK